MISHFEIQPYFVSHNCAATKLSASEQGWAHLEFRIAPSNWQKRVHGERISSDGPETEMRQESESDTENGMCIGCPFNCCAIQSVYIWIFLLPRYFHAVMTASCTIALNSECQVSGRLAIFTEDMSLKRSSISSKAVSCMSYPVSKPQSPRGGMLCSGGVTEARAPMSLQAIGRDTAGRDIRSCWNLSPAVEGYILGAINGSETRRDCPCKCIPSSIDALSAALDGSWLYPDFCWWCCNQSSLLLVKNDGVRNRWKTGGSLKVSFIKSVTTGGELLTNGSSGWWEAVELQIMLEKGRFTSIAWSTGSGSSSNASLAAMRLTLLIARLMRFLASLVGSRCVNVSRMVWPTFSPVAKGKKRQLDCW